MKLTASRIVLALLLLVLALPAFSQTGNSQNQEVNLEQVRQLRQETENSTALAEDLRARVIESYDVAISALEAAANNRAAATAFDRDRTGIDQMVANLRTELDRPEPRPRLELPQSPTVVQAEDALARERARLAANRIALRDQERLAEDRAKSRNEISQRLGELDLELELLNDDLRSQSESPARTELRVAARMRTLARREAALGEIDMLRSKLALLADRGTLIPLEIDLAQRRVAYREELVRLFEEAADELRIEQARESLGRIRELSQELSEELPQLEPIAVETVKLAETLWGVDGVVSRSEETAKELDSTRLHQSQLNRIGELTARKFQAYGHRGSITRWWPDIPEEFPEPGTVAKTVQYLEEEIPEVEHQLITYEQQRSSAPELVRNTILDLETELGDAFNPDLAQRVRELLAVRQDLLDRLIERGGRYSNQLVEYRTVSSNFLGQLQDVERFLFAHVLWSRSVPRPIIPRLSDLADAARWLTSPAHLRSASFVGFGFRGNGLLAALLVALLVLLRQPMRRRLYEISKRVSDPERDSLRHTFAALVFTILLAAPLPMVFFVAGTLFALVGGSTFWFSSASAMLELAMVAALLELIRQLSGCRCSMSHSISPSPEFD
jgi:potassium efflux system protein